MSDTEVLSAETLAAMPDAELLWRLQHLRTDITMIEQQLAEARGNPWSRRVDWKVRAESRLRDYKAALTQAQKEGARRLRAARERAA